MVQLTRYNKLLPMIHTTTGSILTAQRYATLHRNCRPCDRNEARTQIGAIVQLQKPNAWHLRTLLVSFPTRIGARVCANISLRSTSCGTVYRSPFAADGVYLMASFTSLATCRIPARFSAAQCGCLLTRRPNLKHGPCIFHTGGSG